MTHSPSPPTQSNGIPIRDAAAQIPCCARTLRKEIAQGRLSAFRLGRRIYIKAEDFETYLLNRAVPVLPEGQALETSCLSGVQVEPTNPQGISAPEWPTATNDPTTSATSTMEESHG